MDENTEVTDESATHDSTQDPVEVEVGEETTGPPEVGGTAEGGAEDLQRDDSDAVDTTTATPGPDGHESPNTGSEQSEGTGEEVVAEDPPVTEPAYDYTGVYANDGMYVICETQTTVHWFEQKVVGFKVQEDGTEEIVDLGYKAERFEDAVPATAHDLLSRGCTVPVAEEQQVEVLPTQTETNASVQAPQELAVTGLTDVAVPVTLGAIALVVIGAWLIANAQAKRIGRKNK